MLASLVYTLFHILAIPLARSCSFTPPETTPADASPYINPNFIGYHYETATWVNYATNPDGSVNEYSRNMFAVPAERTGGVPVIRLGGSDCDYAQFLPDQDAACLPSITRLSGRSFNLTIGPHYWDLCKNFDDLGAQYIIQVPVGKINISESLVWANTSWATLGSERIQAINILNEPQFYPDQPYFEPPAYIGKLDNESLIDLFLNHSLPVSSALGFAEGQRVFQAFDGGWTDHLNWNLPIPGILDMGIDDRKQIRQVSQHYYPFSVGGPKSPGLDDLEALLFNHTRNTAALDFLPSWLEYLGTFADGERLPFVWGEVTAALGYEPGFQASFGNALWNLDTFLYSMVLGVDSIQYSENFASYFLLWLPQTTDGIDAETYAPFYFVPLLAEFVGNSTKSQAVEMQADKGTENPDIVAYAVYEGNCAKRVALINLDFWGTYEISGNITVAPPSGMKQLRNTTTALPGPEPRNVEPVTVSVPSWCTAVDVRRMSAGLGAYALGPNVTYGGSQWTYESLGKEVKNVVMDSETLQVNGGKVVVTMPATSAALLVFH